MEVAAKVAELIEPSLKELGFDLVRVLYQSGTLQIMAENLDGSCINVENCTEISHTVSALLDVADVIKSHYELEVSSTGLDRPLVRLSDYERFSGREARVDMKLPFDGRRHFKGILQGANGANVRILVEKETVELPFDDIMQGRLEITEAMIKDLAKKQKKEKTAS